MVWERIANDTVSWTDASGYCDGLVSAVGIGTWGLPSRRELLSIVDFGHAYPAIDASIFTGTLSSNYWTGTPLASDLTSRWGVNFGDGGSYSYGLSISDDTAYVRCVAGPSFVPDDYEDLEIVLADDTITDWDTGLNWQAAGPGTMSWYDALYYCEHEASPVGDWRLPNIKELESIVNLNLYNPAVDTSIFQDELPQDPIRLKEYWSSTPALSGMAIWRIDVPTGEVRLSSSPENPEGHVRCVRKLPWEKTP